MVTTGTLTEVEITTEQIIEDIIAGVDAGHRMASHEPDDFDRDIARRQLRGEVTADEAVAKVRSDHNLG